MATSSSGLITSTGIGSNLDITTIVQKLVEAEGAPMLQQLSAKKTVTDSKISALGSLKSALEAFQKAAKALKDNDTFQAHTATSTNDSIVTASADAKAVPGNYTVLVSQIATNHQLASTGFTTQQAAAMGTGSLTFQLGSDTNNAFTVAIDSDHQSLTSIRDAINNASDNKGVYASIVNAGDGAHLIFTSKNSGTANEISVTGTDGLTQLSTANLTEKVPAHDALVQINGFDVTSSSNSITGAVDGLTLDLKSEAPSTPVTVSVATDTEAVTKSISDFVTAFNNLGTVMKNLDSYDTTTKKTGALFADSLVRNLKSQIRSALSTPVSGTSSTYNSLQMIGVEIDRSGVMSFKQDTFKAALAADPVGVASVFSATDGIATRLESKLDTYLQTGGLLDNRNETLQKTLRRISDDQAKTEDRLAALEARLLKQFNAMDSLVASINSTGTFLNQQLTALAASTKKS